jgi:glycosyltransferase involved in cell wall biosynthesis
MRILHVLDHSIPLHSGYTFRTLALLREQRRLGWETFHLTSPKHTGTTALEETVDGAWHFYRTPPTEGAASRLPGLEPVAQMRQVEKRLEAVVDAVRPDVLHAHSPVLNAIPALRVGRRRGIPVVYEVRAFWEDAAVDHGSTTEGARPATCSRSAKACAAISRRAACRPGASPSSRTRSTSRSSSPAASPTRRSRPAWG